MIGVSPGIIMVSMLGPTGFAILIWGSITLVIAVFFYIVWALVSDHTNPG